MNIETAIYLVNILPNVKIFELFSLLGLIASIFGIVFSYVEDVEISRKPLFLLLSIAIFSGMLGMLIPSERTIYLMLGANFPKTSPLPSKIEMAIEKKIDSYLVDEKENKK